MKRDVIYPNISINYFDYCRTREWKVPNQLMPFWRLYWNREDSAYVIHNDEEFRMKPDQFYLIPGNTRYSSGCDEAFHHFYVHFFISWRYQPGVYEYPTTPSILDKIERIIELFGSEEMNQKLQASFIIHSLVSETLSSLPFGKFSTEVSSRLQKAVRHIRDNYQRKVTNEELAAICGMNTSAFVRKFTNHHNVSPHKFLNMVRCNRATNMMRSSDFSLDEIADRTGFCDRYHLSRVYKSIRMISPGAHRKQLSQDS